MELTARQQDVLNFIRASFRETGFSPTFAEIQAHFGFGSPATVTSHLDLLEKKGAIRRAAGHGRTIQLTEPVSQRRIVDIPLFGTIPAGLPLDQTAEADRVLSVDADAFGLSRNARIFALKVRGDSMTGAGILDGDTVLLEHGVPAANGDIVAASIDGEATLKRLVVRDRKTFLKAENPAYEDLTPLHDLRISGVFRALIRVG